MIKALVNNKTFEVVSDGNGYSVNAEKIEFEKIEVEPGYFHVLFRDKSYRAEIVKVESATKTVVIKINGRTYSVAIKDKLDLLLEKMGMSQTGSGKINSIKAPMPGLIIDLKIKEGDSVKQGDALLILEAMKMENIIKSPGEGIVKAIKIKKGQSVEKNQILIEF